MRTPPRVLPRSRTTRLVSAGAAAAIAGVLVAATAAAPAADAATLTVTAKNTSVTVTWRGNGHGHGMSQYGARGAAAAGLSYRQIIAFYYPHTTVVKRAQPTIRVLLSDFGSTTTVAALPRMAAKGVPGMLPTAGIARWRLVADAHSGLTLQVLHTGAGARWANYRTGLKNGAAFTRGSLHPVRIFAPNGTSNLYRGDVRAVRTTSSGAGAVNSVNVVGLERYVAGVAPREMPASWARAAVDAQAIAARTYAQYGIDHPRNSNWDTCDTTSCQFYGGNAYLNAAGGVVWTDDTQGTTDTSGLVAEYRGAAIFAQFSASNGGWSVDGGQPYLVARSDPYDTASSGDPYLAETHKVSLSSLASYYGLSKVTRIVTTTDGNGAWGGRTTRVSVVGVRNGKATTVSTTGFGLADALGAWTDWYRLVAG